MNCPRVRISKKAGHAARQVPAHHIVYGHMLEDRSQAGPNRDPDISEWYGSSLIGDLVGPQVPNLG